MLAAVARALAVAAATALVAGCAAAGDPGGPGSGAASDTGTAVPQRADADLVLWTDEEGAEALRGTVETFAAAADVTAELQVLPDDLDAAFLAANTAGTGPDVVVTGSGALGAMLANGAVEPLALQPVDAARYSERALQSVSDDDVVYGLPYGVRSVALFRNTDLAPRPPATVAELRAAGGRPGAPDPLCLPVGTDGSPEHLHPWYRSAGGYLFGRTAGGDADLRDVGIGEDGSLEAARRFAELADAGLLDSRLDAATALTRFTAGECAFLAATVDALPELRRAGLPVAAGPVPPFAGMQPAPSLTSTRALFIASKARDRELAERFVLDVVNRPVTMLALYAGSRLTPTMADVLTLVGGDRPLQADLAAVAEAGEVAPVLARPELLWQPLGQAEAAIVGGAEPEETMRWAGRRVAEALP